ncbi:hypothetical protein AS850_03535 [Frondihabitans sp. 762G35]|nr:hypothetical protein AS850_03535 [Frondihabitans sp. 762G35]
MCEPPIALPVNLAIEKINVTGCERQRIEVGTAKNLDRGFVVVDLHVFDHF